MMPGCRDSEGLQRYVDECAERLWKPGSLVVVPDSIREELKGVAPGRERDEDVSSNVLPSFALPRQAHSFSTPDGGTYPLAGRR